MKVREAVNRESSIHKVVGLGSLLRVAALSHRTCAFRFRSTASNQKTP